MNQNQNIEELNILFLDACNNGRTEEVSQLLKNPQVNPNYQDIDGQTSLFKACSKGDIDIVKLLLNDYRIEVNLGDDGGGTPFSQACVKRDIEIVKLLSNDGRIDINKAYDSGETPFFLACYNNCVEVVKLLLNNERVDINKATNVGETPFWITCEQNNIEILELLLNDQRVDINKAMIDGGTPFHVACENRSFDVVEYILASEREVDVDAKDSKGRTALEITRNETTKEKESWEREIDFISGRIIDLSVVDLIESFKRNPNETRFKLRLGLQFPGKSNFFIYLLYFITFNSKICISIFHSFFISRSLCCFYLCNYCPPL